VDVFFVVMAVVMVSVALAVIVVVIVITIFDIVKVVVYVFYRSIICRSQIVVVFLVFKVIVKLEVY
jgi:hypothetical protein